MSTPTPQQEKEEGKYIVFADGTVRLFSRNQTHAYMTGGDAVSSAGFYRITDGKVECFGESTTLGIKSHPDDADIIREHLAL